MPSIVAPIVLDGAFPVNRCPSRVRLIRHVSWRVSQTPPPPAVGADAGVEPPARRDRPPPLSASGPPWRPPRPRAPRPRQRVKPRRREAHGRRRRVASPRRRQRPAGAPSAAAGGGGLNPVAPPATRRGRRRRQRPPPAAWRHASRGGCGAAAVDPPRGRGSVHARGGGRRRIPATASPRRRRCRTRCARARGGEIRAGPQRRYAPARGGGCHVGSAAAAAAQKSARPKQLVPINSPASAPCSSLWNGAPCAAVHVVLALSLRKLLWANSLFRASPRRIRKILRSFLQEMRVCAFRPECQLYTYRSVSPP